MTTDETDGRPVSAAATLHPAARGRTLAERWSDAAAAAPAAGPVSDRARSRLGYWRRGCGDDERLGALLDGAGMTERDLLAVLAGEGAPLTDVPSWWSETELLYRNVEPGTAERSSEQSEQSMRLEAACAELTAPLREQVDGELRRRTGTGTRAGGVGALARTLADAFDGEARDLVRQVASRQVSGSGDTAPAAPWAVLRRFPVLVRLLHRRAQLAVEAGVELAERLEARWDELGATSWGPRPGARVVGARRVGDSHWGGRSTTVLDFDCDTSLVYKPRPHEAELAMDALLVELAGLGAGEDLRLPGMVTGAGYAFVEHVSPASCRDAAEVSRFYRRLGGWLAIAYALGETDLHRENLLAVGDQPVLVDLECLFQPIPPVGEGTAGSPATRSGWRSVLSTAALPRARARQEFHDNSALNGDEHLHPDLPDDDEEVPRPVAVSLANRPRLDGGVVEPWAYVDCLELGFVEMHAALFEHRATLQAPGGALRAFDGVRVRAVMRDTGVYARLLRASLTPSVLGDQLDRQGCLAGLWRSTGVAPWLARIVEEEMSDLLDGDVPKFSVRVGSGDLWSGQREVLGYFPQESRLDPTCCLDGLDSADRARQRAAIRESLRTTTSSTGRRPRPPARSGRAPQEAELAFHVARLVSRLAVLAHPTGTGAGAWLDVRRTHGRTAVAAMDEGLGHGRAGVGVFLAAAAASTRSTRAGELLDRFLDTWATQLEGDGDRESPEVGIGTRSPGLVDGLGGTVWGLLQIAALTGDPRARQLAVAMTPGLRSVVRSAHRLDVPGGLAGAVPALLALAEQHPDDAATEQSRAEVRRRLVEARSDRGGFEVRTPAGGGLAPLPRPPAGDAGIATALLALGQAGGDCPAVETALAAITAATARALGTGRGAPGAPDGSSTGWDGTAGLVRAAAAALPDRPELADPLRSLVDRATLQGQGRDHSLGEGDLGLAHAVGAAAAALAEPRVGALAADIAAGVTADLRWNGPRCGGAGGETPGLLTGLAGIGYGLLALRDGFALPFLPAPDRSRSRNRQPPAGGVGELPDHPPGRRRDLRDPAVGTPVPAR